MKLKIQNSKCKIGGCMVFNDSAIRDRLVILVAILLFNAIQRPSGAIAVQCYSLSSNCRFFAFSEINCYICDRLLSISNK